MRNGREPWMRRIGIAAALIVALSAVTSVDADARHRGGRKNYRHQSYSQRVVVQHRHVCYRQPYRVRAYQPPVVVVGPRQFIWSASLGFYVPSVYVNARFGEYPPVDTYYYDPYCHIPFATLTEYRVHLHRHHHPAAVDVSYYEAAAPYASGYGHSCGGGDRYWDDDDDD